MDAETFDAFLDDATHKVHELWQAAGGRPLSPDELYRINDVLREELAAKRGGE